MQNIWYNILGENMEESKLEQRRKEIDSIDYELAQLLIRRFKIIEEIAAIKKHLDLPVEQINREEEVYQLVADAAKELLTNDDEAVGIALMQTYFSIITISKKLQR